jgi:hypothetical protein
VLLVRVTQAVPVKSRHEEWSPVDAVRSGWVNDTNDFSIVTLIGPPRGRVVTEYGTFHGK